MVTRWTPNCVEEVKPTCMLDRWYTVWPLLWVLCFHLSLPWHWRKFYYTLEKESLIFCEMLHFKYVINHIPTDFSIRTLILSCMVGLFSPYVGPLSPPFCISFGIFFQSLVWWGWALSDVMSPCLSPFALPNQLKHGTEIWSANSISSERHQFVFYFSQKKMYIIFFVAAIKRHRL